MATDLATQGAELQLPDVQPVRYRNNVIQKAVCELKFPTLYGLERENPPAALANALRKLYPQHSILDGLNVGPTGVAQNFAYVFADKKARTQVVFRASSVALETSSYQTFESFLDRLLVITSIAQTVIDSDFFTRVGLRYINALPYGQGAIGDWVNPQLVGALSSGVFGTPAEFNGRIAGKIADDAGFTLSHGIGQGSENSGLDYVLDLDFWQEDVPSTEIEEVVTQLHDLEHRMFHWSLAPAAFAHMGPSTPKEPREPREASPAPTTSAGTEAPLAGKKAANPFAGTSWKTSSKHRKS